MKWLDAMLGRTRLPKANLESFFALTTAQIALQAALDLLSAGRAGVCFKPVTSSDYRSTESTVRDLIKLAGKDFRSEIRFTDDEFGYTWCILEDPEFEDLVGLVYLASKTMADEGFSEQLLSAVFGFREQDGGDHQKTVYLIYNYKRGTFYPFVPHGDGNRRDNSLEFRLASLMEVELPMEKEPGRWYPVWNCPV